MPLMICNTCGGSLTQVFKDGKTIYRCSMCGREYDEIPTSKEDKPSTEGNPLRN